jgi:hypothetical protein
MDDAPMLLTDKGKPDTTARGVLQALAEHASADGSNARPSVMRIQYRTGYDETTVRRALRRLEKAALIKAGGTVQGCVVYRLALKLRRPASDWTDLEEARERERAAATERKRRSRAKDVTDAKCVTVTSSESVTSRVTDSASGRHALEVRDVTDSASGRHGRNAPRTTKEPLTEPPGNHPSPQPPGAERLPAVRDDEEGMGHPAWIRPLLEAMSAVGINVPWAFLGDDLIRLHNDIKRLGIPLMVKYARSTHNDSVFSSRFFYGGWHRIPTPALSPDTGLPVLRAVPDEPRVSRQQQETDDMFDRAARRAEARMQAKESS